MPYRHTVVALKRKDCSPGARNRYIGNRNNIGLNVLGSNGPELNFKRRRGDVTARYQRNMSYTDVGVRDRQSYQQLQRQAQ